MRTAASAAALIKQHDPVDTRIEEGSHLRVRAAARSAVQENSGFAVRVAAFFKVQLVHVRDAQKSSAKRLNGGIESPALSLGHLVFIHFDFLGIQLVGR